jgi:hypothetical protein
MVLTTWVAKETVHRKPAPAGKMTLARTLLAAESLAAPMW